MAGIGRSACAGAVSVLYYGVYHRHPIALGGCPAASGFHITQQLDAL